MKDTILTPNKFALIVENMVKEQRISYIDAILEYCKETLKEKIAYEAQNLNMLKEKVAKLPI